MFDRPRCRDWSPLSTQQLRLRSLIQISGHNIVLPELGPGERGRKCTVYYTLHQTPQSAPFYTSEKLDLHRNVLWAEIDCPATIKSSLRCVCVRVWMHRNENRGGSATAMVHARDDHHSNTCETEEDAPPSEVTIRSAQKSAEMDVQTVEDRVLFVWGVYFSGLVPLVRRSEKRLQPNTLVFQMHGGFFTSASCILEPEEQKKRPGSAADTLNIPKTPAKFSSSGSTVTPTIPIDAARRGGRAGRGTADNVLHCDTSNNSSPLSPHHPQYGSCSPPKNHWFFMNGGGMEKLSISPGDGTGRAGSDRASGDGVTGGALFQPTFATGSATPTRWAEPTETNLKIRYLHMEFLQSEVLDSYDLERLLAVQERQRRMRYEADSVKELINRISMKSAYCLNLELFDSSKHTRVYRTVGEHQGRSGGMGKQLSRLLYQEREPIDPVVLLRGQDLRRDIERARFRCRLLAQERDRISQGVLQHLRNKLNMLSDRNIERESALMERYRNYGKEKEQLYQQKMAYASQKDSVREVCGKVLMVRHRLLKELNGIYYIKPTNQGIYTINDVPLPNAESYSDSTPALALSVALGFVAHAVMMCSSFLDIPLRNPIKYDGSRSKIVDHIKLLPTMDREFPLHCRSGPAPNALLYGLKHQLSLSRGDPRATLVNLQDILAIPGFGAGGGGAPLNRELEEPFQMLPTSAFGSSAGDLKMSPAFNSLPGVSSSGSSSSGSFLRESPSNSRFQGQGRRQMPMLPQRQVQFTPGQQARNCGSWNQRPTPAPYTTTWM
ncbi:AGAP007772-PA-like protein [Anopheles sinensis]|uniref:AGAP007772-PA-like protein n=1 Tax=Anopheles sinensis TaxID=74873 RepID=A0A084W7K4_ANOSI|nr:AGAP007772-PA-like protein [Anopheles sinensis]